MDVDRERINMANNAWVQAELEFPEASLFISGVEPDVMQAVLLLTCWLVLAALIFRRRPLHYLPIFLSTI